MAATSGDVDAAALAHGAGQAVFGEDGLKAFGGVAAGGRAVVASGRVERDEIYLGKLALEQAADGMGGGGRVIFSFDERPLVEDAALASGDVGAAGGHELVERPFFGGGDEGGALFLCGGVKRNGEVHGAVFFGEAQNARHDANGAERDARAGESEAGRIAQDVHGAEDGVVVVQWFAHAHEDEVAQAFVAGVRRDVLRVSVRRGSGGGGAEDGVHVHGLGDDFAGSEVAGETHLSRSAKHAAHRTAGLATDTGGDAARITHEHGLDAAVVGEIEQVFAGEAVGAAGFGGDREKGKTESVFRPAQESRRQFGHLAPCQHALKVNIAPQAAGVRGGKTSFGGRTQQVLACEVKKIGRLVGQELVKMLIR